MVAPLPACAIRAAHHYHVPPARIEAVIRAPRGLQAIGPMGIPPTWLPVLARNGFDVALIPIDRCSNIRAGAWILSLGHGHRGRRRPEPPKPPKDVPPMLRMRCSLDAARAYHVGYRQIIATLSAAATARSHHHDAGIGPMGIPVRDLDLLADYGFPPHAVATDACRGMIAGIWLLGLANLGNAQGATAVHSRPSKTPPAPLLALFRQAAKEYHLSLALLLGVASQESGFDPGATSSAGARGIMQMIAGTAHRFNVSDPYDPRQEIPGAARYIVHLQAKFGDRLPLVLAAYNAGGGAVVKYGDRIPPFRETEKYVPSVLGRIKFFKKWLAAKLGDKKPSHKIIVASKSEKSSHIKLSDENSGPKIHAGISAKIKNADMIYSGMKFTSAVSDKISSIPIARKFADAGAPRNCSLLKCSIHVPAPEKSSNDESGARDFTGALTGWTGSDRAGHAGHADPADGSAQRPSQRPGQTASGIHAPPAAAQPQSGGHGDAHAGDGNKGEEHHLLDESPRPAANGHVRGHHRAAPGVTVPDGSNAHHNVHVGR